MNRNFKIRPYSKTELGLLYAPNLPPKSAEYRLMSWINLSPVLQKRLEETGYTKACRIFTPKQVELIVEFLGEP